MAGSLRQSMLETPVETFVNLDLDAFVSTCVSLLAAFVLGGAIGLERQIRQRVAGLRTMVLVAVGAAAFVHLGARLLGPEGETRIIAYVVSGIGFLGAGVIMKEGVQVRGLNTAATLWSSAAVGAFAGSGLIAEAAAVTVAVLAGNTLLRPVVNYFDRQPLSPATTEALYKVHVIGAAEDLVDIRELLDAALNKANYPVQAVETLSETDDRVELGATLLSTTADAAELDAVCTELEASDFVTSATWTVGTTL